MIIIIKRVMPLVPLKKVCMLMKIRLGPCTGGAQEDPHHRMTPHEGKISKVTKAQDKKAQIGTNQEQKLGNNFFKKLKKSHISLRKRGGKKEHCRHETP
jgi:hypothetical protein